MVKKPFYITCAIPYVNGPAHIGHVLEFTTSDVLARYFRGQGFDVLLEHGADQHGTKNYEKALELGKKPQAFADEITASFKKTHEKLNISYDRFIETTSPQHQKSAQAVWKQIVDAGDMYKDNYIGWYCTGCEEFVKDSLAEENGKVCPTHKKAYEQLEEENYFFRLSKYGDQIAKMIRSNDFIVTPESRKNEILSLLDGGLDDISVSRPASKLPWGVAVPGDKKHVMYVWFEAVINYLSVLGYPDGDDYKKYWPAEVMVIGKDILRFHAAIFPAMLLSTAQKLPKVLYVHGHIGSGGQKMSKTLGNVVDPFEIIENYGADALRYYVMRHIPSGQDGDFTWEKFEHAYNGELANDLGNLVQRTAAMVTKYQSGVVGDVPHPSHDSTPYHEALARLKFDRALDHVWSMIQGLNQYIDTEKPWEVAKEDDQEHLQEVLSYIVGSLVQIGTLLHPFMPESAEKLLKTFEGGVVHTEVGALFPKIYIHTEQNTKHQ